MVELPLHVAPAAGLPVTVQVWLPEMRFGELVNVSVLAGQLVVIPPCVPFWAGMVAAPLDGTAKLAEPPEVGNVDVDPRSVHVIVDADVV